MFKLAAAALTATIVASSALVAAEGTLMPRYEIDTTKGTIIVELNGEKAPITVLNFDDYVEAGHFNGLIFHRVIPGFVIQTGGFEPDFTERGNLRPGIRNEWQNGLSNERGTLSMARVGGRPNSARSQFFINLVDNRSLDVPRDGAGYAVFGRVIEGMDVADAISSVETRVVARLNPRSAETPVENIIINSITRITDFDRDAVQALADAGDPFSPTAIRQFIEAKATELDQQPKRFDSGLVSFVLREGTGTVNPSPTQTVEVHYHGTLIDGTVFDSSVNRGQTASFGLNQVIRGWTEGVGDMVVGEKRLFVIPPDLAYGPVSPSPAIPPNSTLVFEVELINIR